MLNPEIYRAAAARLERTAKKGAFAFAKLCCPAISGAGLAALLPYNERQTYKAVFGEWFQPEGLKYAAEQPWWPMNELLPRLIALDLMAEICEGAAADQQAKVDAIDHKLAEILKDYIGKVTFTERTLMVMQDHLADVLLGGQAPKWLKLLPVALDRVAPANLPTALVLAGYADPNHHACMPLAELEFLELFNICTTADGVRWRFDPEQGKVSCFP